MATDTALEIEMGAGDLSAADVAMLTELVGDDEPKSRRGPKIKINLAGMTREERLRHDADLAKTRRHKKAAMMAAGSLKFDEGTARDALADAALMILASGTDGADAIMAYLTKLYHDKTGVPYAIQAKARFGKFKPKLLGFADKAS